MARKHAQSEPVADPQIDPPPVAETTSPPPAPEEPPTSDLLGLAPLAASPETGPRLGRVILVRFLEIKTRPAIITNIPEVPAGEEPIVDCDILTVPRVDGDVPALLPMRNLKHDATGKAFDSWRYISEAE